MVYVSRPVAQRNQDQLSGRRFVITGQLETMSRDQAQDHLEQLGAVVSSQVSGATTDILGQEPGSKWIKAQKQGIEPIFMTLCCLG